MAAGEYSRPPLHVSALTGPPLAAETRGTIVDYRDATYPHKAIGSPQPDQERAAEPPRWPPLHQPLDCRLPRLPGLPDFLHPAHQLHSVHRVRRAEVDWSRQLP